MQSRDNKWLKAWDNVVNVSTGNCNFMAPLESPKTYYILTTALYDAKIYLASDGQWSLMRLILTWNQSLRRPEATGTVKIKYSSKFDRNIAGSPILYNIVKHSYFNRLACSNGQPRRAKNIPIKTLLMSIQDWCLIDLLEETIVFVRKHRQKVLYVWEQ